MSAFTDEQINEIIGIFTQHMGTRQYIGARYVPIFGRKDETSIEWDNTKPYEPLTIVLHQGNSYTSRQYVPSGVDILNTEFWANTGNYNSQVEQYRTEVLTFDERITDVETAVSDEVIARGNADQTLQDNIDAEAQDRSAADTTLQGNIDSLADIIPDSAFDSTNTVKQYIDNGVSQINDIIPASAFSATNTVKHYIDNRITNIEDEVIVIFGDSWAAPDVPDSKWPSTIAVLFGNAEIHNYATNGCHTLDNSFSNMYQAFINDDTWDKSTITKVIMVYGVNDFYTYPVAREVARASIISFYTAIIDHIPDKVPIHWFINCCYGKHNYEASTQIFYWDNVTFNVLASCPRMVIHNTISWFNYQEFNSSNYYHLTEGASRGHFAHNIYQCMTGGEPVKFVTCRANIEGNNNINILMDICENFIKITIQHPTQTSVINEYIKPSTVILPQVVAQLALPMPGGGYAKFQTGSSDGVNVNRVTYIASATSSDVANSYIAHEYTIYPVF